MYNNNKHNCKLLYINLLSDLDLGSEKKHENVTVTYN